MNNGFVRPLKKLVGGKYPSYPAEEGGVTYGFGFHGAKNGFASFTPVVKPEVSGSFFELEMYVPEPIQGLVFLYRIGGNDNDALDGEELEWHDHDLGALAGGRMHRFKLPLEGFGHNTAFRLETASPDDVLYIQTSRVIPVYTATPEPDGRWEVSLSCPFPYGMVEKEYEYRIFYDDEFVKTETVTVCRDEPARSGNPVDAACQWVLNRLAAPGLQSERGSFPLFFYDSFAKTFFAGGEVFWIRPYPLLSLIEIALRRDVDSAVLEGVKRYVLSTRYLDRFSPEKRIGYFEYCGCGNYFYGACAMLLHVLDDDEVRTALLTFVDKYLHSQNVYTKMGGMPAISHQYKSELPTITVCGCEETMHAAVVEAYRQSGRPELLHEALYERGVGYMEHPVYGGVAVPDRLAGEADAAKLYGYYTSMHIRSWARSRDAIHYRAEGLIRLYEVTGDEQWIQLASRRASNYMRYIGEKAGDEFLDVNFEYPRSDCSQYQTDESLDTATGSTDGEYFQDIYTSAGILQHDPSDLYLREKVRRAVMMVASTIRMNTDDPESYGEAWIPHYAWQGDYENRSAGSRLMSPGIAAGTLLKAGSAGFRFEDGVDYTGPLAGCRKVLDAASVPEAAPVADMEGFFDVPDGTHEVSRFEIRNAGSADIAIEEVYLNGRPVSGACSVSAGNTVGVDLREHALAGRQNHFKVVFAEGSSACITIHHRFQSRQSTLYGTAMDEYFGGRFVRRNLVLNNPYAPVAEKSFHIPGDPESYYRQLPEDEGYETASEASYLKTWRPFMELGCRVDAQRAVDAVGRAELRFKAVDESSSLVIYNDLWTDQNGEALNGAALDSSGKSFVDPQALPVIRVQKDGELDPLHPECTLPAAVYREGGVLHADIVNYPGTSAFTVALLTGEPVVLGIPKRSENTRVQFNQEAVFENNQFRLRNGFGISSCSEDDAYVYLHLQRKGKIRVRIGSDSSVAGKPAGVTAARIDPTGITSSAVRVRWQPNLEENCSHYNVYRKPAGQEAPVFAGWSPEPVFTDFSGGADEPCFYCVQAVLECGEEGALSEWAQVSQYHS